MKKRAFTLIEILIVISILALIVSLVAPDIKVLVNQFDKELSKKKNFLKEQQENYNLFICGKKKCEGRQDSH